jgi:DNA-binding transcriptional ArsR family regulator
MVKRMLGPPAVSASALSKQVDVPQPTLSQWLRAALERTAKPASAEEKKQPAASVAPRKWTAEEKLRVLAAAHGLRGEGLGALLRREGLHEEQLEQWQQSAMGALAPESSARPSGAQRRKVAEVQKRVKELERELRRKDKALAETAALLVVEKKLQALGWDERHSTEDEEFCEPSER